jgi:hypothetical protein
MIVHVRRYGSKVEFEDSDTFTYDEELATMAQDLSAQERVVATGRLRGLAPILEPDDDYEDFDTSAYVGRTYQ